MANPTDKNHEIRKFQSELMGTNVEADIRSNVCVQCKGPADQFKDRLSAREYTISGMCQKCQDRFFDAIQPGCLDDIDPHQGDDRPLPGDLDIFDDYDKG